MSKRIRSSRRKGRDVVHEAVTVDTQKDAWSQQQTQIQPEKLDFCHLTNWDEDKSIQ
jgi:hypothetical protein